MYNLTVAHRRTKFLLRVRFLQLKFGLYKKSNNDVTHFRVK